MTTLVSAPVRYVADQVVHDCGYKSAALSGIVPNIAHLASGGFHCSINDLKAHGNGSDFSNTRADDKGFNPAYGAAVDVSMSKTELMLAYQRCHTVWADHSDPRRRYFNAVNVWDGTGDATRLDFDRNTAGFADASHKFHTHMELHRRYVLDMRAARAMVSMYKGESKAAWIAREEAPAPQPPKMEDDMPSAEEIAKAVWATKLVDPYDTAKTPRQLDAGTWLRYAPSRGAVLGVRAAVDAILKNVVADDGDRAAIVAEIAKNTQVLAAVPTEVAEMLTGAGHTPEETAAALRAVLGDRAAEVGRLLAA
jgi:sRNA-binding protein